VEKFQKDERYLNLTSKVSAAIETLNEYGKIKTKNISIPLINKTNLIERV
jgi:hypothetical protein